MGLTEKLQLAESEPRVDLNMGRKIIEVPKGKGMISRVVGADGKMELAESEPRVDLSMGMKIIEIPQENEGFWRSWGSVHRATSLNLSLG